MSEKQGVSSTEGDVRAGLQALDMPDFCRAMVDASPIPMAFLIGNKHILRYVNAAFCELAGQPEQQLVGESFAVAVPGSGERLSILDRVHRTGKTETHSGEEDSGPDGLYWSYVLWPVVLPDHRRLGTMIQVTETTPFHNQTIAVNQALMVSSVRQHELREAADTLNIQLQEGIIQRKRAEEEMGRQQIEIAGSERRFRGLIEAIPQIVWTATPEGRLDFANTKWLECFGADVNALNEAGWSGLLHPDDLERSVEAWESGLQSESAFQMEHRLRNLATGNFRWYFTRAVPIPDGESIKWFGTTTDIDERKRADAAAFARQKFESLGVLAGGIAHDFNNLLAIILGGAGLVGTHLPQFHPLQENVADIVRASERAAHLTRQMLAFAGKGSFLKEAIDVSELVRTTCELIRTSLPASVRLTVQSRPQLPPAQFDRGQMQQVVTNLVLNAAEAIDESTSGWIAVRTDLAETAGDRLANCEVVTGSLGTGSYVVVEIEDNGSGMSEATKARILEPFFTTKFTGRGLGLAAVGGILRAQNGALEVQSAPGKGSTFRVYLPASPVPAPERKKSVETRPVRGEGTILIVDDEEMVRKVVRRVLENGGFTVLLADGGEEALRILQRASKSPISLVILDLSMPAMSGRRVLEAIRVLGIDVPTLICSGYSEADVNREFAGVKIAGVIPKPFKIGQLVSQVQKALDAERQR